MFKRLQDTISESRKLGAVSDFAHRCWTVGLPKADWYGRLTAEPGKFRLKCFPNRPSVTDAEISGALDELADVGGEGLIHLYLDADGDRYLVYHRHEQYNPTGGWKTKPRKCPPPPKGLCKCCEYFVEELSKPLVGRSFRFSGVEKTTDHTCDHSPLLSSPLLVGREGGPGGEGGDAKEAPLSPGVRTLIEEFSTLTSKPSAKRPDAALVRELEALVAARGLPALLSVLRERVPEYIARNQASPGTLHYFLPVFKDERVFTVKGAIHGTSIHTVRELAIPRGTFGRAVEERIRERDRQEGAPEVRDP